MEPQTTMYPVPKNNNHFAFMENLEELVSPIEFHPFFHKIEPKHLRKWEESKKILEDKGFKKPSKCTDLEGKYIAFPATITDANIISYRVDGISLTDDGFRIFQNGDPNVKFVTYKESEEITETPIEEIFIPFYLMDSIVINDNPFVTNKNRNGNYPKKEYLTEREILKENPALYDQIHSFIEEKKMPDLELIACETQNILNSEGINNIVTYRHKNIEGVYSKLMSNRDKLSLKNIYDINGISIQVEEPHNCYMALNIINSFYPIRFYWDYIAEPKPNGFQCLLSHTDHCMSFETQIRTFYMYEVAENGSGLDYRGGNYYGK